MQQMWTNLKHDGPNHLVPDVFLRGGQAGSHKVHGAPLGAAASKEMKVLQPRLTAAVPMDNPCCSCKLTRVSVAPQEHLGLPLSNFTVSQDVAAYYTAAGEKASEVGPHALAYSCSRGSP